MTTVYSDKEIEEAAQEDAVIWAYKNVRTEKRERLDFNAHPYQMDIMSDESPDQCVRKGSQVGMTTIYVTKLLHLMDNQNLISAYTFPTSTDVFRFSKGRFKPMILASDYLRAHMSGVDNASMKGFKNSFIYFNGAFTESQSISIPCDILIHDEIDYSDPQVLESYTSRLSHSKLGYTWKFSTPTLPEYGIDLEYANSDQRSWLVKCIHCNFWQEVKYPNEVQEGPFNVMKRRKYKGSKFFITYWGCVKCKKELDRTNGKWVRKYRTKHTHGYYISPTICSWIKPIALKRLERKSRTKRLFYNSHLGLAYAGGVASLTRDLLLSRSIKDHVYSADSNAYFIGADQGDVLHIEVSKMREDGGREVFYVEKTTDFDRLKQLIQQYGVLSCILDGLPNAHSAKEIASQFPGIVKLVYYQDLRMKEQQNQEFTDGETPDSVLLDRSESLDSSANQWTSGQASFTYDNELVPYYTYDNIQHKDGWIQQMCNMKRDIQEDKKGQKKIAWVKTGADHFRHADNYNYIAWKMNQGITGGDVIVGGKHKSLISSKPTDTDLRAPLDISGDFMVAGDSGLIVPGNVEMVI